jgi:hypothetical protein
MDLTTIPTVKTEDEEMIENDKPPSCSMRSFAGEQSIARLSNAKLIDNINDILSVKKHQSWCLFLFVQGFSK